MEYTSRYTVMLAKCSFCWKMESHLLFHPGTVPISLVRKLDLAELSTEGCNCVLFIWRCSPTQLPTQSQPAFPPESGGWTLTGAGNHMRANFLSWWVSLSGMFHIAFPARKRVCGLWSRRSRSLQCLLKHLPVSQISVCVHFAHVSCIFKLRVCL